MVLDMHVAVSRSVDAGDVVGDGVVAALCVVDASDVYTFAQVEVVAVVARDVDVAMVALSSFLSYHRLNYSTC